MCIAMKNDETLRIYSETMEWHNMSIWEA
jgi:hypothetical protein